MMHIFSKRSELRAFTLVETLVAIAILMIAIVGPFYSIQQAITTSFVARDQLIASQLAQEGEEYIYFLRDTNYLSSASWLNGMDACFSANGCTVDPLQGSAAQGIAQCQQTPCPPLGLNPNSQYTQSGGTVTRFTRTVTMTTVSASQVEAKVTVSWITSHHSYSVVTKEELYNWL